MSIQQKQHGAVQNTTHRGCVQMCPEPLQLRCALVMWRPSQTRCGSASASHAIMATAAVMTAESGWNLQRPRRLTPGRLFFEERRDSPGLRFGLLVGCSCAVTAPDQGSGPNASCERMARGLATAGAAV